MRYLLYLGCVIPTKQYAYEVSLREVFPKFGVQLEEFNERCCGFPLKSINKKAWLYMGARVLARASELGLPILAPCNGCHVSLWETKHQMEEDPYLKSEILSYLKSEGLYKFDDVDIKHPVEVLHDIIGLEKIKEKVVRPLQGLKIASHPGCHLMRPTDIPRPEDNANPDKIDRILRALGAESYDYPDKGGCCGATMLPFSPDNAIKVGAQKILTMINAGFNAATTSCPYCMEMLDNKQDAAKTITGNMEVSLPVFYLTQLVGLAIGIEPSKLLINLNMSPVDEILAEVGVV
jgi:heterodisulfide reductase subunit B